MGRKWEPAAEAALITLLSIDTSPDEVQKHISQHKAFLLEDMMKEWKRRAEREGDVADMSDRYPPQELDGASKDCVNDVMSFIVDAIRVIEIGAGTGRITQQLVTEADSVVCVDICPEMLTRNKSRLTNLGRKLSDKVKHVIMNAADYKPDPSLKTPNTVVVCSQVLIHNVAYSLFRELIENLTRMADRIFVFEDVTQNRRTSPYTCLRSEKEYVEEFEKYGFMERGGQRRHHNLCGDNSCFSSLESGVRNRLRPLVDFAKYRISLAR